MKKLHAVPVETRTPTILVLHGVPLMRLGIAAALREAMQTGTATVQVFADVTAATAACGTLLRGDVLLVDSEAWGALEQQREVLAALRNGGVAIALVSPADQTATRLLEGRGVAGVIAPHAEPAALVAGVVELLAGRTAFQPRTAETAGATGLGRLSNRQFEILELMTRGLLNKQIAWELGLTEGTVKSHVSAILEKLGCDRRTQAIATFMKSMGIGRPQSLVA